MSVCVCACRTCAYVYQRVLCHVEELVLPTRAIQLLGKVLSTR